MKTQKPCGCEKDVFACQNYADPTHTTAERKITHTPGPWKYHLGRGADPRFHIQNEGGYQIASTTELVRHNQAYEENAMREANARLIAAAPELLQIAKAYRNLLKTMAHTEGEVATFHHIEDVLANVEGL